MSELKAPLVLNGLRLLGKSSWHRANCPFSLSSERALSQWTKGRLERLRWKRSVTGTQAVEPGPCAKASDMRKTRVEQWPPGGKFHPDFHP